MGKSGGRKPGKQQKRDKGSKPAATKSQRKKNTSHWKSDDLASELQAVGLKIIECAPDGNCFFRALSEQLNGHEHDHGELRSRIVDYIESHQPDFAPFVEDDESFEDYCTRMRQDAEWAGNIEVQAASLLRRCNLKIFQAGQPIWTVNNFPNEKNSTVRILHLSYHDGQHYNSVRNMDGSLPDRHSTYTGTNTTDTNTTSPANGGAYTYEYGHTEDTGTATAVDDDNDGDNTVEQQPNGDVDIHKEDDSTSIQAVEQEDEALAAATTTTITTKDSKFPQSLIDRVVKSSGCTDRQQVIQALLETGGNAKRAKAKLVKQLAAAKTTKPTTTSSATATSTAIASSNKNTDKLSKAQDNLQNTTRQQEKVLLELQWKTPKHKRIRAFLHITTNSSITLDDYLIQQITQPQQPHSSSSTAASKRKSKHGSSTSSALSGSNGVVVGRNQPCPCGSKKKYKQCCGTGGSRKATTVAASSIKESGDGVEKDSGTSGVASQLKELYI